MSTQQGLNAALNEELLIAQDLNTDQLVSIIGTFRRDFLVGDAIAEDIVGDTTEDISGDRKAGNDLIFAKGGADKIYGDTSARLMKRAKGSNDLISGGEGNDRIYGDALFILDSARGGNDWIFAEGGNDDIFGDASTLFNNARGGNDHIFGGEGNDTIHGDAGQLNNHAQGGNDRLFGGQGNDFIFGDGVFMLDNTKGGDDVLVGGEGNDALFGDSSPLKTRNGGNDILTGVNPSSSQPGVGEIDNFTGNGGRDRFIFGDARTAYYVGQGDVDHGIINDFSFADKDIIQLHGKAINYELKDFSLGRISGIDIILKGSNELIGSVLNQSTATLNINSSAFDFVG
jgi:Ca2+-binding RTX toxin-like protein